MLRRAEPGKEFRAQEVAQFGGATSGLDQGLERAAEVFIYDAIGRSAMIALGCLERWVRNSGLPRRSQQEGKRRTQWLPKKGRSENARAGDTVQEL